MLEYRPALLKENRNSNYTIASALARAVADGWHVHTWLVLKHEHIPNDSNHGHGFDVELEVSVLFEREVPA